MTTAQPATFMLLPDFAHKPNQRLHLGTLLLLNDETQLPDPDVPLNTDNLLPIAEQDILTSIEESWTYTNEHTRSGNVGVTAELPVFSPVGGGLVLGRSKSNNLAIACDRVETIRFSPSKSYLAQSLAAEEELQVYCRQRWFPSVYMITGLKVAYNAMIGGECTNSDKKSFDPSLDATASGIPLKIGVSLGMEGEKSRVQGARIEGPFIMAYQLKRLYVRRDTTLRKDKSYNKYALFDDADSGSDNQCMEDFDMMWETEDVSANTEHQ